MKKRYCFVFTLLCFSWCAFSQMNTSIRENYQEHFKYSDEEAVFLHLNKTSYLVGEEIWFKGYTFSQRDGKSSPKSSNLYVGLYDINGKQVSKKLVHIENGFATGNFELDVRNQRAY